MVVTLEERIRRHAPGNAFGYFLITPNPGGPRRYPPEGAFRLKPFAPPSGAPFGTFLLYFVRYEGDKQAMTSVNSADDAVRITLSPPGKATDKQLTSNSQSSAEADTSEREHDNDEEVEPAKTMADLELAIASTPAMITARADFEKQRMAMELAENNQELLIKGNFSRDAAEALALNRAYRREAQITIEAQANLSRRTAEEVQSHWAVFRMAQEAQADGLRILKEQLELFARPAPPPPQVDYTPVFVEGLKSLRDFSVAMVQSRAGVPFPPPQPKGSVLPNESTMAQLVPEAPPEPVDKDKPGAIATPSARPESTPPRTSAGPARVPAADGDVFGPAVASVPPVASPSVTRVAGVIDATSPDPKAEATRLLKALAETTEFEALFAMLSPEQFQAFLKRLRQRASLAPGRSDDAP